MDFHSLSRKELQALCKKNKIPANITNVAMANALQALQHVEGLDELLSSSESNGQQSPEKTAAISNNVPPTACRSSTRRNMAKEAPSSQPVTRSRRVTRRTAQKESEENKCDNVVETPAMPTSRRRGPSGSAIRKMDTNLMDAEANGKIVAEEKSEISNTPAMPTIRRRGPSSSAIRKTESNLMEVEDNGKIVDQENSEMADTPAISTRSVRAASARSKTVNKADSSLQKAYSTRRSVRLLEQTMAELTIEGKWASQKHSMETDTNEKDVKDDAKESEENAGGELLQTLKDSDGRDSHSGMHDEVNEEGSDDPTHFVENLEAVIATDEKEPEENAEEVSKEESDENLGAATIDTTVGNESSEKQSVTITEIDVTEEGSEENAGAESDLSLMDSDKTDSATHREVIDEGSDEIPEAVIATDEEESQENIEEVSKEGSDAAQTDEKESDENVDDSAHSDANLEAVIATDEKESGEKESDDQVDDSTHSEVNLEAVIASAEKEPDESMEEVNEEQSDAPRDAVIATDEKESKVNLEAATYNNTTVGEKDSAIITDGKDIEDEETNELPEKENTSVKDNLASENSMDAIEFVPGNVKSDDKIAESNKIATPQKMPPLVSDNKENVHIVQNTNTDNQKAEGKSNKNVTYEDMSLRQLTKLFKEKLTITKGVKEHAEKPRQALQAVQGNQIE